MARETFCIDRRLKERYGFGFAEFKSKKKEGVKISILKAQIQVGVTKKNPAMLMYLGKVLCGQVERIESNVNITNLSDQELLEKAKEILLDAMSYMNRETAIANALRAESAKSQAMREVGNKLLYWLQPSKNKDTDEAIAAWHKATEAE